MKIQKSFYKKNSIIFFILLLIIISCKKSNDEISNEEFSKKADWFLKEKNYRDLKGYKSKFTFEYKKCLKNKQYEQAKILLHNFGDLVYKMWITDSLYTRTTNDFMAKNYPVKKDSIYAYIQCNQAHIYNRNKDHIRALFWINKAIEVNKNIKSRLVNENAKNLMANVFMYTNQFEKAIQILTELIMVAENEDDYKSLASLNYNVAMSYYYLNAYTEADKMFEKSANAYLKSKDNMRYIGLQKTRAIIDLNYRHDTIKTLRFLDSLAVFHKSYKNDSEVNRIILADLKINQKILNREYDSAFYFNKVVHDYSEKAKDYLVVYQYNDILIYYKKYKKLQDEQETKKMIAILLADENYFDSADLCHIVYENAKGKNHFKEALLYRNKEIELRDSILVANQKGQLFEFDKKYQSEKKEKQIAQQQIQISKNKSYIVGLLLALTIIVLGTVLYYSRKRKQEAKAETKRQEQFTFQLLQNTEEERSRIANELHDSVNHDLLNIKNSLINGKTIAVADVANVIEEVRNISRNLHPAVLETIGFEVSIENLCERLTDIGLFTTCDIEYTQKLSKNKELQLYRIIQEALNNTLKHGKANAAKVILNSQNNMLHLEVKDNGTGFDVNQQLKNPKSFGLQSIIQRAKAIAAKINIDSSTKGTIILLKIPL